MHPSTTQLEMTMQTNQTNLSEQFMVQQMTRTNHILHLILSLITFGLWVPVWILAAMNNAGKRSALTGGMVGKAINIIGKSLTFLLVGVCVLAAAVLLVTMAVFA
jgi:hypothetical protein